MSSHVKKNTEWPRFGSSTQGDGSYNEHKSMSQERKTPCRNKLTQSLCFTYFTRDLVLCLLIAMRSYTCIS